MSINRDIYRLIYENLDDILKLRGDKTLKTDGSYVTKGDLLCQSIVLNYVQSLPDNLEIISEEINLSNFSYDEGKDYIVIDPIDGTENFTSGLKEWGISISIFKHDKHNESMIMLPELNICIVTGEMLPKYHSRIHGLSSSLSQQHFHNLKDGYEYRIIGCCVYNMYYVITGSFSTFENPKGAHVWDILAGLNLAIERGLDVLVDGKRYNGEFLHPTKKYCFKIKQQNE